DFSTPYNESLVLKHDNSYQADIGNGIVAAEEIFFRATNRSSRQLIYVISAPVSTIRESLADSFKKRGGIIAVTEMGKLSTLPNLASPGYHSFGFNNISTDLQTLCDVNCFCPAHPTEFAFSDNERNTPNRGCYSSPTISTTYEVAKEECAAYGYIMTAVHDSEKEFFIQQVVSTQGAKLPAWIGYEWDIYGYHWTDTYHSTYTNWAKGEPNLNKGDCVYTKQTTGFNSA
ncbi:hypothetical protein PFISCL1PPCAC_3101, partial [Pristionchus fissidentatus]